MEIQIKYSAKKPHTDVWVNGRMSSEEHGPLGAVARYPLQSWLYRRGAWPGIEKVLRDIARGRAMDITFTGREVDYVDLIQALSGLDRATFQIHDSKLTGMVDAFPERLQEMETLLKDCPDEKAQELTNCAFITAENTMCISVRTVEDYWAKRSLIEDSRILVTLDMTVFSDTTVRDDLYSMLREHFQRPGDSIVLLAHSEAEKISLFESIAEWGAGMKLSVMLEGETGITERLIEKYSMPEILSRQIRQLGDINKGLEMLLGRFSGLHEALKRKKETLQWETDNEREAILENEYDHLRKSFRWWQDHRKRFLALQEQLAQMYIS